MKKKEHILTLAARPRKAQYTIAKQYEIGQKVMYKQEPREIISIYNDSSVLCGYILLSGIGKPVLASDVVGNSLTIEK